MTKPKAYEPIYGQMYQILTRNKWSNGVWEHCDYAIDKCEQAYLLGEYELAYRGSNAEFKIIRFPKKYWKTDN